MWPSILMLSSCLILLLGIGLTLRARSRLFEISVGKDVRIRGMVPDHPRAEVEQFVRRLGLPAGSRIRGVVQSGHFRTVFSAGVPDEIRRRLYIFLHNRKALAPAAPIVTCGAGGHQGWRFRASA